MAFNYNSQNKMKEVLNKFLDRIIIEVLINMSSMSQAVSTINMLE